LIFQIKVNYHKANGRVNVDTETLFRQFGEIETKIEKLIQICGSQQAANLELHHKIQQLEEELRIANETVKRHAEEKALIRSRVDTLLARLEEMNP
jgi:predicted nuclease with TOPRIM domain